LGEIVGRVMAHETAVANRIALDLLELQPDDQVLDVGCGHGRALAAAAEVVTAGFLAGIDYSEVMIRIARSRNARLLCCGRMELSLADSGRIPYPDCRFNKVLTVHTIYFWPDLKGQIEEIRRVMTDNGRLVIGYRPAEDERFVNEFPESVYRIRPINEMETLVAEAGLRDVETSSQRSSSHLLAWTVVHKRAGGGP
jgi:ubiquinone/menaquinone biosynthesis C-methylase UbiE